MNMTNTTNTARAELVAEYRRLGRGLNEFTADSDARALGRARAKIQGEIDAIDAAAAEGREATSEERTAAARKRAAEVD